MYCDINFRLYCSALIVVSAQGLALSSVAMGRFITETAVTNTCAAESHTGRAIDIKYMSVCIQVMSQQTCMFVRVALFSTWLHVILSDRKAAGNRVRMISSIESNL